MKMDKRGQVTIFVIIGIILLMVAALLVQVPPEKLDFDDAYQFQEPDINERVVMVFESCADNILSDLDEQMVENIGDVKRHPYQQEVTVNGEQYKVVFDRSFPIVNLPSLREQNALVEEELMRSMPLCFTQLDSFYDKWGVDNLRVEIESLEFEIGERAIVDYELAVVVDGQEEIVSGTVLRTMASLQLLDSVRQHTASFLQNYEHIDSLTNYLLCKAINGEYGQKPVYPLDYIGSLLSDESLEIIPASEYVAIKLKMDDGLVMRFAWIPTQIVPAC